MVISGRGIAVGVGVGVCAVIGTGSVVVMQGQSVGMGIGVRLTIALVAMAVSMMVVCRHGVPRARQHSGRAFSGGAWGLESLQACYRKERRLQAVSGRIGSEGSGQGCA